MITTQKFYEAFDKAGFLKTALWTPSVAAGGGPEQSEQVRLRSPLERQLAGDALVSDYTIRYPQGKLPGLRRDEALSIAGVAYRVREGPYARDDGSVMEAKLDRVL